MKVTPYSKEPYYPMLLSNGTDGILVDYSGSNFISYSGHTHWEQPHGAVAGWYKATSRSLTGMNEGLIMQAGYQMILYGDTAEPEFYEQSFDANRAILTTKLIFNKSTEISVESFLTNDGLWCEKITLIKGNDACLPKIGFLLMAPHSGYTWLTLRTTARIHAAVEEKEICFNYTFGECKGLGALWTDSKFQDTNITKDSISGDTFSCLGMMGELSEGMSFSRILTVLDETECEDIQAEMEKRRAIAAKGYDFVKEAHIKTWNVSPSASVHLPRPFLQQIYDMGRYIIRSSQNQKSGATLLGIQPHLWNGGLYCSYDTYFIIKALFKCGFHEAAEKCARFIRNQMKSGQKILSECGVKGAAAAGWTDCKGNFSRKMDLKKWFLNKKPMFPCIDIMNLYTIWQYSDREITEEQKELLKAYIDFTKNLLAEKDGRIGLIDIQAGIETAFDVETDSFTTIVLSQSIRAVGEMIEDNDLIAVADTIAQNINENYTEEGILLPFKNAPYIGGMQADYFIFSMMKGISESNIDTMLFYAKTHWGYDVDCTAQTYRHWPWMCSRAAICYTHLGEHEKAMEQLEKIPMGASALGVLPEKIRLDGAPINYWYTSPAALAVWAVNDAMCFGEGDTVYFAYGITADWQDFSAADIHLENGLSADITVSDGAVRTLILKNLSERAVTVKIKINSAFRADVPECVTIDKGAQYIFHAE